MNNKKRIRLLSDELKINDLLKISKDYKRECKKLKELRKHKDLSLTAGYYDPGINYKISTQLDRSLTLRRKLRNSIKLLEDKLYG